MKVFILVFVLTIINYSKQQTSPQLADSQEQAVIQECITSTNVDPSLIEKAFKEGKFVEDKNLKCFIKCMFVKMGDMTEDGKLNIDKIKSQAPPGVSSEQASKILDKCKDETGDDACDTAYNAAKCMVEEAIKLFATG